MDELVVAQRRIPVMNAAAVDKVREIEGKVRALDLPQVPLETYHVLHGGLYARTICIPAGVLLTGALVKVATVLIVVGTTLVYIGEDEPLRLEGYNVLPASAGRKQAFLTETAVEMTAIFPTRARSIEEAEREFTDEVELLGSRRDINRFTITGE